MQHIYHMHFKIKPCCIYAIWFSCYVTSLIISDYILIIYIYFSRIASFLFQKVDPNPTYDYGTLARYTFYGVAVFPIVYNRWYVDDNSK